LHTDVNAVPVVSGENRPTSCPESRLSVIFFGRRAAFSSRILHAVARTHRVVAIVESEFPHFKAPPAWRKWFSRSQREEDIEDFARRGGIPYFRMTKGRMAELATFIGRVKADIGFIAMMAHLLPESIIKLLPRGILNVHPSLLPVYRGPLPLFWTVFNQEPVSGVTIHYIDPGEDTGDIIRQAQLPVGEHETAAQLALRCADLAAQLAPAALNDVAAGTAVPIVQRDRPCPFRARLIKRGENPIDWQSWPVSRVYAALRAAYPMYDLMPARPFPYSLFDWVPAGVTPQPLATGAPHFVQRGFRLFLATARGMIHLRPRWSTRHLKRALHGLIYRTQPPTLKPAPAMATRSHAA
jgi:methionyl-tRNA formyltransferase